MRQRRLPGSTRLLGILLVSACAGMRPAASVNPGGAGVPSTANPFARPFLTAPSDSAPLGAFVRLSPIGAPAAAVSRTSEARPISDADALDLLTRSLGPAAPGPAPAGFRFAPRSLPAPRPGADRRVPLFAGTATDAGPAAPVIAASGPLRVVSTTPRGAAAAAAQVAVTFSRAMVPLSSLHAPPPGVSLTPAAPGAWRWLDPYTLVFDAAGGLPGAATYTVDVPAGLRSVDGETLRERVRWTFETAAPAVSDVLSTGAPDPAQPVLLITFDQSVDEAAVVPYLRLAVDGREHALRLATPEERALLRVRDRLSRLPSGRTLAVRPEQAFAVDDTAAERDAVLRVLAGTPSAEGPRRTVDEATHAFRIERGLRVLAQGCGRSESCPPGAPWTIRFSGWLREAPDSGHWVRIEPPLPGATVEVWSNHIVILGAPARDTTYTVWLEPSIATFSGDELGTVPPLRFRVGPALPAAWAPGGGLAAIPPGSGEYPVLIAGADSARVSVRTVNLADWPRFARDRVALRYGVADPLARFPGRELFQTVLPVTASATGPGEAVVDLGDALDRSEHLLLIAEPLQTSHDEPDTAAARPASATWVQRASLVLEVAEDEEALTVRVLSPDDWRPVAGAVVEVYPEADVGKGTSARIARERTNAAGVATLRASDEARGSWVVLATRGADTVLLPAAVQRSNIPPYAWLPQLRTHFLTDRPIYAPLDTVRFAGWLRIADGVGREPSAPPAGARVAYTAAGPRGETLAEDTLAVGPHGRLEGAVPLPPDVNAGWGGVQLTMRDSAGHTHYARVDFQIEEVRRPNFDVEVRLPAGPHIAGQRIDASADARYFTGGGLVGSAVNWTVSSRVGRHSPPGAADYAFGLVRYPGRRAIEPVRDSGRTGAAGDHRLAIDVDSVHPAVAMYVSVEASVTDVDGRSRSASAGVLVHPADVHVGLRTPAPFVRAGEPLSIEAVVLDLEGRPAAGRPIVVRALRQDHRYDDGRLTVVDAATARCALRSGDGPVRCRLRHLPAGDYVIAASVEDGRGRRSESQLAVRVAEETIAAGARAARDTVRVLADRAEYEPGDTALLLVQPSFGAKHALLTVRRAGVVDVVPLAPGDGAAVVRLPIRDAYVPNARFHVVATAADGRVAAGSSEVQVRPLTRTLEVGVRPRAAEVAPGAATTVAVTVTDAAGEPVAGADVVLSGVDEALLALTWRRPRDPLLDFYQHTADAVLETSLRAHLAPPAAGREDAGTVSGVLLDGVTGRPIPRAWVALASGAGAWTGPNGVYRLTDVPAGEHGIEARADGYVTARRARVAVPAGGAARAHMVLFTRADVLAGWAALLRPGTSGAALSELRLRGAPVSGMSLESNAMAAAALRAPSAVALVRENFSPVAAFVTGARTGGDGRVEIPVTLPHNLTRYRLRAVAVEGHRRFGAGESTLTARLPLMVRPMPPRFLNQADRFELPVLVENRTGEAVEVDVVARASNAELTGPVGRRVVVPAGDRVEVRFAGRAGRPGDAVFQVVAARASAAGGAAADIAEARVPVLVPIATEAFAVYGQLDDARPVAFPLRLPAVTLPGQGRVEVGFATTAVHGLRDALWFLLNCFYDLPEVAASRILALGALKDVPAAQAWPVGSIEHAIRADVIRLARLQLRDGGWSVWPVRFDADPFISVHAAHALHRARTAGAAVPERTISGALAWLRSLDEHAPPEPRAGRTVRPFPNDYPRQARRAVQAFALKVRADFGDDVAASAAALLNDGGATSLPAEALAWLLPALAADPAHAAAAAEVRRELSNRIVRSAGTATVVSPYDAGGRAVYHSPRRTDAVVLGALVADRQSPDLVAALARGLMAHRVRGRWSNTQENAFAIAALAPYLAAAEAVEPALTARAWAGARLAGELAIRGRADERHELLIPVDSIGAPDTESNLILRREGAGRLYYRVALRYATADPVPAIARGFEVGRTYEAVDDPGDVRRDGDGNWYIRRGARVRVRITVANAGARYHVAVVDPLPAGLEAINPALTGDGALAAPSRMPAAGVPPEQWFPAQHVNVRAERFEAFTTLLPAGRREITYFALATTPGEFAAPAPRAEEMYATETFGRGVAGRVTVEAR